MAKHRDYTKLIPRLLVVTGWSPEKLAEKVGCGARSIYRYKSGELAGPTTKAVKKSLDGFLDSFGIE